MSTPLVTANPQATALHSLARSARDVCARLGNVEVLSSVSLQFPAGCWTSVVGPNGAGKST